MCRKIPALWYWFYSLRTEEMLARSKKNPRRVGADFHDNLRRAGLLDTDDEKWYASCWKQSNEFLYFIILFACVCVCVCVCVHRIGCLPLGVYGIMDQDHTQSWFPLGMLKWVPSCLSGLYVTHYNDVGWSSEAHSHRQMLLHQFFKVLMDLVLANVHLEFTSWRTVFFYLSIFFLPTAETAETLHLPEVQPYVRRRASKRPRPDFTDD